MMEPIPCLLLDHWIPENSSSSTVNIDHENPVHSILITVFNHESLIKEVLTEAIKLARESFEIIVVLDGCTDNSLPAVLDFFMELITNCGHENYCSNKTIESRCLNHELTHIRVIYLATGVFETSANNVAMRASRGKYWHLIQDDQTMQVVGYNAILASILRLDTHLLGVSARCGHSFYSEDGNLLDSVGRCGSSIDNPLSISPELKCTVYIRNTANRGPLTLRADYVQKLGYLDEVHYYLEHDEHDLFFRGFISNQWLAAVYPLDFYAPLSRGSSRKGKSKQVMQYLKWRREKVDSARNNNTLPLKDPVPFKSFANQSKILVDCEKDGWWKLISHDLDDQITIEIPVI